MGALREGEEPAGDAATLAERRSGNSLFLLFSSKRVLNPSAAVGLEEGGGREVGEAHLTCDAT